MLDLLITRTTFLDDDVIDGNITESDTSFQLVEDLELHEAIELCRNEGVDFASTGNDWAASPDGSRCIDLATGKREEISIKPQGSWWPWEYEALVAGVDAKYDPPLSFGYVVQPA